FLPDPDLDQVTVDRVDESARWPELVPTLGAGALSREDGVTRRTVLRLSLLAHPRRGRLERRRPGERPHAGIGREAMAMHAPRMIEDQAIALPRRDAEAATEH